LSDLTWSRSDVWFAASIAAVALLVIADLALGHTGNVTGTLVFAPYLASATTSARRTAVVAVVSLGFGVGLALYDSVPAGPFVLRTVVLLAAAALAPAVAAARERQQRQALELAHVAEVAQLAVLTPVPPLAGPVALATAYRSASREALIGGDLYAVVERPNGVRILVGDVRGKGLDAVQLAAVVLSVFRETAPGPPSLDQVALAMDRRLQPYLQDEDFVTAVFADIDASGAAELLSCGHPPPILVRAHTHLLLEPTEAAAPLGLDPQPRMDSVQLQRGDRLLFYTDGLIESRARDGGFVDLDPLLVSLADDPLDAALRRILDRLHAAAGETRDDLALLLAEFIGSEIVE
jgi:sigma-B regulation protein RsbU (phosphoserine phosphatase)